MPLDNNSVLNAFKMKNQAPDFDAVKSEDFKEAIILAIEEARANIKEITDQAEAPSFENTLVKLEEASEAYDVVTSLYFNLLSINKDDALLGIEEEVIALCQSFGSEFSYNEALFARVKALYDQKDALGLDDEQSVLLEDSYKGFVRNGANLSSADKQKLKEVNERLSVLSSKYGNNVLDSKNEFQLFITDKSELDGLPEWFLAATAEAAKEAGHDGEYLLTLDFPVYYPILQFAKNRELRKKIWFASGEIASQGAHDNKPIVEEILELRQEKATLLGFDTYADYVLDERMAKEKARVFSFLDELKQTVIEPAKKELEEIKALAVKEDNVTDFEPWDMAYYVDKYKQESLGFNDEDLRPYYKLENVLEGCFEHASSLFSLRFEENKNYNTYHKDVRAFDVFDTDTGDFVGTLYADFFPRKNKRGGAWETSYRKQGLYKGATERPVVAIACNFTKPSAGNPSLITQNEVETLFHEMGHALHDLLAQAKYRSVSGTAVKWDFVELPSQVQENWTYERETLDRYARHVKTGDKMPEELYQKLRKSSQFMRATFRLRQISLAMLDMKLHATDPKEIKDIESFETELMKDFNLLASHGMLRATSFTHIFDGGYAAGYYSYQWAELLDADAFEAFQEKGLYHKDTASALKRLYSMGASKDPNDLYKEFRGREADPQAMLRRDGLAKQSPKP